MDAHSLTAPARVRCLLVPLGQVTPRRFHQLAARLQQAYEVRLGDVTGTSTRQFNPLGFPAGRVLYDFATAVDSQEALFLHDFEPFRKTFVVVGLADAPYEDTGHDLDRLKKSFSAIVSCAVVFDRDAPAESPANILWCNKQSSTETVMCDVTRLFLIELNGYLSSYQHITLRSPGQLGSNDRAKPTPPLKNKRISSGASIGLSLNPDAGSKLSFKTAGERRHARVKGRQTKILGNLLLLAGKYTDALKEFNEAIVQLKAGNDYLWLGSALEGVGVCFFMLTYLGMPYQIPTSVANVLVSSNVLSVMSPSTTPSASPRNSIATITAGASPSPTLNGNGGTPPMNSSSRQSADLEKLPIPDLLMKIFEKVISFYELSQNDPEDYVPSLVYCESILRCLKFMTVLNIGGGLNEETTNHIVRGKPFTRHNNNDTFDKCDILKISNKIMSIQLRKMDILSQTRIYTSLASLYGDLGFERKKSFMTRTLFVSLIPQLNAQVTHASSQAPMYDLQDVINTILSVYGISLSTESDIKDAFSPKWIQLQKSIIKLCISVCEEIKDFKTVVALKSLLLTRYLDSLTDNEQHKVYQEIQDISRKHSIQTPYFDPFILRGVHIIRPSNPPKKHSKKEISSKKVHDPIIYNPYDKTEIVEKNYIVQEEFSEFLLVLQNPFAFPIVINDIKMENVEILRTHFTIAPKTLQKINILTKPHTSGKIIIDSVSLQIGECTSQWFKIAKSQKIKLLKKLKKKTEITSDILSSYIANITSNNITSRVELDSLELDVIPAQPSLQVLNSPEPLMLLEGGKHRLTIVLKNNSPVSVNVLDFSIWDNTIEPLKRGLEDKDMPADEVYEFEYYLYKQALEIISDIKEIKPFEEVPLEIEVQGKRGVNKINLILDYGHSLEGGDVFTRSLEIPLTAIVHSSTDLADCNVVPLNQEIDESKLDLWKFVKASGGNVSDWCLFLVDFRNLWNKALTVEIGYEGYKTQESIVPMETKRLLLPIKRIDLDYENIPAIPSLSGKQYIVPKISKAEYQFQREIFWYREEILKKVKGTWSAGGVSGDLELRAVRLTQKMLNVLKFDKVGIEIKIPDAKFNGLHHEVKTGEFITVAVEITNHTERTLKGIIRNVPTASSYGLIDRRLLFNGMLQQNLPKSLAPGESLSLPIGAVVLERGEYEWGAVLDEQGSDAQHICRRPLRIKAF